MSNAQDIIGEIDRGLGDIQKNLTLLMGTDYTQTPKQSEAAQKAQTNLTLFQEQELHDLRRMYE